MNESVLTAPSDRSVHPDILAIHRAAAPFLAYQNPVATYRPTGIDHTLFLEDDPATQGSLPQLRRGGVAASVLSVGIPSRSLAPLPAEGTANPRHTVASVFNGAASVEYVLRSIDDLKRAIAQAPEDAAIVTKASDIEAVNAQGKIALLLHLTGAWCNNDLKNLHEYYRRGVRGIHICVEGQTGVGDPSGDAALEGGLTAFGADVVREMNRLGMVVDIAHAADHTAWQIIETSSRPVITSHTWCRTLRPGVRGLPDDLMRAVAETGGVVGLFLVAEPAGDTAQPRDEKFHAEFRRRIDELWQKYGSDPYEFLAVRYNWDTWKDLPGVSNDPSLKPKMRTVESVLEHIDYAVNLIGIDHIGLGPDYEMGVMIPDGLETAAQLPLLTAALLDHGYSKGDVKKILGGNFTRVYREITG